MTPTAPANFLSRVSASAQMNPDILIFMLFFLLLVVISACYILLKMRSTGRELIAAERDLEVLAHHLSRKSPAAKPSRNHLEPATNTGHPKPDEAVKKAGSLTAILGIFRRHVWENLAGHLPFGKTKSGIRTQSGQPILSLKNNSDLNHEILELIGKTGYAISLQQLAKRMPGRYFDGNYHPILNGLEQLEREGAIEGQAVNGKVVYTIKQKTERQYILRKGKNFRKYIG